MGKGKGGEQQAAAGVAAVCMLGLFLVGVALNILAVIFSSSVLTECGDSLAKTEPFLHACVLMIMITAAISIGLSTCSLGGSCCQIAGMAIDDDDMKGTCEAVGKGVTGCISSLNLMAGIPSMVGIIGSLVLNETLKSKCGGAGDTLITFIIVQLSISGGLLVCFCCICICVGVGAGVAAASS